MSLAFLVDVVVVSPPDVTTLGLNVAVLDGADFGHRGLRAVPQVGAGLGACVEDDGDGLTVFGGAVVGFGFGAVVVVTGCGATVVCVPEDVRVAFGRDVFVAVGAAVVVGCGATVAVGRGALVGVGLSLTSTRRVPPAPPPKVEGITESGNAWNPMKASRPVATVASMTMTTEDSSGPRCVRGLATACHLPVGLPVLFRTLALSAGTSTDCTGVVTLCEEQ